MADAAATHVIVVTVPAGRGLSDPEISEIAARVAAGPPRRLGTTAAEIACGNGLQLRALRHAFPGLDINIVPVEDRRKQLLIADMDSTMIPVECIDEVADFAGVKPQVSAITERAMRGEIDFSGALRERVSLIAGLPEAALADVYEQRINLNPGARTLVRTMAAHDAHCALVSGGFTYFTERVAEKAGFAENRANRLLFEDGKLTGKVAEPVLGRAAKLDALHELTETMGIGAHQVLCVGDGANDQDMIQAAGLGVAYRAKPALVAEADAVIDHADLTALLYLQGYAERDFVLD